MSVTFVLPELGENIESGTVTAVLVAVGDSATKDQPVTRGPLPNRTRTGYARMRGS